MARKKIEVVELDKEKEKIVLEEEQSSWVLFWKKYNKLILLILLILSITVLATGVIITISNLSSSEKMIIKQVSIDTDLNISNADVTANVSLTDETAKKMFQNGTVFKASGEVLLVKMVSHKQYIIKFYSDYTAIKIMKNDNFVTRINAIDGNRYGIKENGVINSKAEILDISKNNERKYSWGTVIYYSDGSAEIVDSKVDMFVRNAKDINDNYISNNKVSYLKERTNVNGVKLNYYYDGTIEVIKANKSYLVRDEKDLVISGKNITFSNDNQATIMNTVKLSDGIRIDYYTDGGAIITDGNEKLSVRKSNSIVIKDNKIFEIVDNIYVDESKTNRNGNVIYYNNGSAVIKNYNGKTIYVHENSDIKYRDGKIYSIGDNYEELTEERNINSDKVLMFETVAVVDTDEYTAIVPKNSILYNSDGSFKEILVDGTLDTDKAIKIANNTNDTIKYRIVIEESNRTTLDARYIKYQLSTGNTYIEPKRLDSRRWMQDEVSNSLVINGTNYILLERTLLPQESDSVRLMLWTDYDSIPNEMQNKYFYGTIRIYAWQEIKTSI